jgi:hypothetical protein
MNTISTYSEILSAYSEKVGIHPLLAKTTADQEPAPSYGKPTSSAPKDRTLYTRVPEPSSGNIFSRPATAEPDILDKVRDRILSRRRSRFTKEGIVEIPSEKITGR